MFLCYHKYMGFIPQISTDDAPIWLASSLRSNFYGALPLRACLHEGGGGAPVNRLTELPGEG